MEGTRCVRGPRDSFLQSRRFGRPVVRLDLVGAAIFGVGWGLAGLCPGPAFVASLSSVDTMIFVVAAILGMRVVRQRSVFAP